MTLWVLGINHQTAPVDLRERVAFDAGNLPVALASLRALSEVSEAALLSTCNRTELYAIARDSESLTHWLSTQAEGLDAYLYRYSDADAVRHLFRVATGLDSMVLGEPQILGQVKDAWVTARENGAMGSRLDRLFQQTFAVAKRARTDTRVAPIRCRWPPPRCVWRRTRSHAWTNPRCCWSAPGKPSNWPHVT